MTNKPRIYLVSMGDDQRLIRALNRTNAVAHFASSRIKVSIPDQDDLLAAGRAGMAIEEAAPPKTRGPRNKADD